MLLVDSETVIARNFLRYGFWHPLDVGLCISIAHAL
jgi:hypothetical protein